MKLCKERTKCAGREADPGAGVTTAAGDSTLILSGGLEAVSLTLSISETLLVPFEAFRFLAFAFLLGVDGTGPGVSGSGMVAAAELADRLRPIPGVCGTTMISFGAFITVGSGRGI